MPWLLKLLVLSNAVFWIWYIKYLCDLHLHLFFFCRTVVKHSLIHHILHQFFLVADPESRSEIIESLNEVVPEILHTKDGSRVAMQCIWHGTPKVIYLCHFVTDVILIVVTLTKEHIDYFS